MFRSTHFALACLVLISGPAWGWQPKDAEKAKPAPTQEELEKQFAESLSGATLVGRFTIVEEGQEQPLKEDRYTLGKVFKLPNGLWQFETRIQYGNHDVKLPLALNVKWAGDTPMISMTDIAVPGLGTFTARVLFYRGQYAGTWSGKDHGGHMFGKIEKAGADQSAEKTDAAKSETPK
jgi:hypothetical protein